MHPLLLLALAVLGLGVGSLLTSAMVHVPAADGWVRLPFRCRSCATAIRPIDAVPVASWLMLRGRCRACGAAIGWRYPAIELATAGLFVAAGAWLGLDPVLPAMLYLAAMGVLLFVIDLDHKRLPDVVVLPSYIVVAGLLAGAALVGGDSGPLWRALAGGAALFFVYLVLALVNPAGMGGGDVKLAGVLGMGLGWFGWGEVAVGGMAGFFLGAFVGGGLMLVGKAGRKTAIPFGPFMIVGAIVGLAYGESLAAWYLRT